MEKKSKDKKSDTPTELAPFWDLACQNWTEYSITLEETLSEPLLHSRWFANTS